MLHDECFYQLVKFEEEKRKELTCPICRQKVNKGTIVKINLLEPEVDIKVEEAFKIGDQESQVEVEEKEENQAAVKVQEEKQVAVEKKEEKQVAVEEIEEEQAAVEEIEEKQVTVKV